MISYGFHRQCDALGVSYRRPIHLKIRERHRKSPTIHLNKLHTFAGVFFPRRYRLWMKLERLVLSWPMCFAKTASALFENNKLGIILWGSLVFMMYRWEVKIDWLWAKTTWYLNYIFWQTAEEGRPACRWNLINLLHIHKTPKNGIKSKDKAPGRSLLLLEGYGKTET